MQYELQDKATIQAGIATVRKLLLSRVAEFDKDAQLYQALHELLPDFDIPTYD
jgi:hypothetical protein